MCLRSVLSCPFSGDPGRTSPERSRPARQDGRQAAVSGTSAKLPPGTPGPVPRSSPWRAAPALRLGPSPRTSRRARFPRSSSGKSPTDERGLPVRSNGEPPTDERGFPPFVRAAGSRRSTSAVSSEWNVPPDCASRSEGFRMQVGRCDGSRGEKTPQIGLASRRTSMVGGQPGPVQLKALRRTSTALKVPPPFTTGSAWPKARVASFLSFECATRRFLPAARR